MKNTAKGTNYVLDRIILSLLKKQALQISDIEYFANFLFIPHIEFRDVNASIGRLGISGCIEALPTGQIEVGKEEYITSSEGQRQLESVREEDENFWNFLSQISEGRIVLPIKRSFKIKKHPSYSIDSDKTLLSTESELTHVHEIIPTIPSEIPHEKVRRQFSHPHHRNRIMSIIVGGEEIANFIRATSPISKKFYDPINQMLEKKICPLGKIYGLKKISEAIEGLDYVRFEKSTLWIRADDSVYLRIHLNTKGNEFTSVHAPSMFLWDMFSEKSFSSRSKGRSLVPVASLSNDKFNEYQRNILNRINELYDCVGKFYGN